LGYRIQDRKLLIHPDESSTVTIIFERYLALESMPLLLTELRERGIKTRVRNFGTETVGGVPFTLGPSPTSSETAPTEVKFPTRVRSIPANTKPSSTPTYSMQSKPNWHRTVSIIMPA
jgi:hypothetical protein